MEGDFNTHAWTLASEREQVMIRCETYFLTEATAPQRNYDLQNLLEELNKMIQRALAQGKENATEAYSNHIAMALQKGAGAGLQNSVHRFCASAS